MTTVLATLPDKTLKASKCCPALLTLLALMIGKGIGNALTMKMDHLDCSSKDHNDNIHVHTDAEH